jgi:hypothetical protein
MLRMSSYLTRPQLSLSVRHPHPTLYIKWNSNR